MDYPYVIVVNGKPETMFSPRDFEYLLERDMGHDAVEYFRRMTGEQDRMLDQLRDELGDVIADSMDLENEVDSLRDAIRRWRARYEQ